MSFQSTETGGVSFNAPPLYADVIASMTGSDIDTVTDDQEAASMLLSIKAPEVQVMNVLGEKYNPDECPDAYVFTEELKQRTVTVEETALLPQCDYSGVKAPYAEYRSSESAVLGTRTRLTPVQRVELDGISNPGIHQHGRAPTNPAGSTDYLPGLYAYALNNVTLYGPHCLACTPCGKYVVLDGGGQAMALHRPIAIAIIQYAMHLVRGTEKSHVAHYPAAISLTGRVNQNYYHWIVDYLPKLRAAELYYQQTGVMPTILIPSDIAPFAQQTLELLGFWEYTEPWDNNVATIGTFITMRGGYERPGSWLLQPAQLEWVRSQFLAEGIDTAPQNGHCDSTDCSTASTPHHVENLRPSGCDGSGIQSRHLYLSREAFDTRFVENREELLDALPQSVTPIRTEEMSFAEQIAVFSRADTVVAPHGAALTNLLWGTNIDVVEIYGEPNDCCYYQIASHCGHAYRGVQYPVNDQNGGIVVDVGELAEIVRSHCNSINESGDPNG